MPEKTHKRVVGLLSCPDSPDIVTVVHCELCAKSFAAPGGVGPRAALLMLSSHLRALHRIDVKAETFALDHLGSELKVWIYE